MTEIHQSNLAAFFADSNIEALRETALAEHGIDIRGVYCLHTGRLVGTFDDFVLQFAIDEESTDDEESLIDALVARTIASMRPSPMLNKPDRITLLNLAAKFPVDVMAFLVNRLHSNRHLYTHRIEILDPYIQRIGTHRQWTHLAASGVDLIPWIHWLLELDAKRNLHDLTPPCIQLDRLNKWLVCATGTSMLQLVTPENSAELLAIFERWTFERVREFEKRDREATAQANWMRGNSMTQPAYSRSWLENPDFASKRAEMEFKSRKRKEAQAAKPKSEKVAKLDAKTNQFLHLLEGILDGETEVPTPKKAAPRLLVGSMLFAKKES